MSIYVIGMGSGELESVSGEGIRCLFEADYIFGPDRMLAMLPEEIKGEKIHEYKTDKVISIIEEIRKRTPEAKLCVVFGGDTGIYSGATKLVEGFRSKEMRFIIIPGISSVQLLSARLGIPWQNWKILSAHGNECDGVKVVEPDKKTFFLTGGRMTPRVLCEQLAKAGFGETKALVGECLGTEKERIVTSTVKEISEMDFDSISVLLVWEVPGKYEVIRRTPGIPDEDFIRDKVPMTKQEVRAVVMSKLGITPCDICWDIGAGTGSVSVEMALCAPFGKTFGVEFRDVALELMKANRDKFGVGNLEIIKAKAPEGLRELPCPDAVFVGGSKGNLKEIITTVLDINDKARLCINAVTLESLSQAVEAVELAGFAAEVSQVSVARTRKMGRYNMLEGMTPVFIISKGARKH